MQKIRSSFGKMKDADLAIKALHILTEMTNNDAFPTPFPPLAEISTAFEEYRLALNQVATGGRFLTETKNQKRAVLEDKLNKLGMYVQMVSNNDLPTMLSSGFRLTKAREKVGPIPKASHFRLEVIAVGTVKLVVKGIEGALSYIFEYKKDGDLNWTGITSSKAKLVINNLESGKRYAFRVVGIGTDPTKNYSDEIWSYIL
jgi:hypothetical protein